METWNTLITNFSTLGQLTANTFQGLTTGLAYLASSGWNVFPSPVSQDNRTQEREKAEKESMVATEGERRRREEERVKREQGYRLRRMWGTDPAWESGMEEYKKVYIEAIRNGMSEEEAHQYATSCAQRRVEEIQSQERAYAERRQRGDENSMPNVYGGTREEDTFRLTREDFERAKNADELFYKNHPEMKGKKIGDLSDSDPRKKEFIKEWLRYNAIIKERNKKDSPSTSTPSVSNPTQSVEVLEPSFLDRVEAFLSGSKNVLTVKNVIEENYDGTKRKGMTGYSIIKLQTGREVVKMRVNGVVWGEDSTIEDGQGGRDYEHPLQDGKYKLRYRPTTDPKSKYQVEVYRDTGNYENGVFVHRGYTSEGCIVLGDEKLSRSIYETLLKLVKQDAIIELRVGNRDLRSLEERRWRPLPWKSSIF
ncbi:hypothetical protein [Thermospira aquatica]|uniref:DUF2778 domain-containing protein n=1 Tax=Thermospira aquatica TaxID=2828656 RepID=A0AAX3BEV2_9SPIR|nr:hypothetical protein [Thermospira aquatica]URA10599.1 hypothetical protein KDW03_02000 [Thermospira aquatica]